MKRTKWYISGAISASSPAAEEANKAHFYRVEDELTRKGRTCINPVRMDEGCKGWSWEDFLARDLILITQESLFNGNIALYMMKGWELSRGARLEHAVAKMLKLQIEYEP